MLYNKTNFFLINVLSSTIYYNLGSNLIYIPFINNIPISYYTTFPIYRRYVFRSTFYHIYQGLPGNSSL